MSSPEVRGREQRHRGRNGPILRGGGRQPLQSPSTGEKERLAPEWRREDAGDQGRPARTVFRVLLKNVRFALWTTGRRSTISGKPEVSRACACESVTRTETRRRAQPGRPAKRYDGHPGEARRPRRNKEEGADLSRGLPESPNWSTARTRAPLTRQSLRDEEPRREEDEGARGAARHLLHPPPPRPRVWARVRPAVLRRSPGRPQVPRKTSPAGTREDGAGRREGKATRGGERLSP